MSKEKDFLFHVPIEITKSEDEQWQIQGIASTGDVDLQGEQVDQEGLDISALKAGRGILNWDHQNTPENILGQIEDADFVKENGKLALKINGYLFKHQDRAKAVYNILQSVKKGNGPRVHMSIEGKILDRDVNNPSKIKKARINKVALTLDPVNPYTFAQLCKSLSAETPVEPPPAPISETVTLEKADFDVIMEFCKKAMAAGAGYANAPQTRTGGEATSKESLDSKPKSVSYGKSSEKKKKSKKSLLKSIIGSLKAAYPTHDPLELAEWAIEAYLED